MLLLPLSTIIVIVVVSFILLLVIVIAISRSTCYKGKRNKDKRKAKEEELDRFLSPDEESEDEILSPDVTNKHPKEKSGNIGGEAPGWVKLSSEDTSFYFNDVTVQESIDDNGGQPEGKVDRAIDVSVNVQKDQVSVTVDKDEPLSVDGGLDEVVVLENAHVVEEEMEPSLPVVVSPVPIFVKEPTPPPVEVKEKVALSVTFETDLKAEPPIDAVVINAPTPAQVVPPPEAGSDGLISAIEATEPAEPPPQLPSEPIEIEIPTHTDILSIPGSTEDHSPSIHSDVSIGSQSSNHSGLGGLDASKKRLGRSTNRINSKFSEDAILTVHLHYIKSVKCLKGSIISIQGLNYAAEHVPQEINFHLRFFPNKKFHMATKYKPITEENDTLNLTFTMGPVYPEDLMNNKLRVKLYGKKAQRLTRAKCYGECGLDLYEICDRDEVMVYEETLIQRIPGASGNYTSSDSDGVM